MPRNETILSMKSNIYDMIYEKLKFIQVNNKTWKTEKTFILLHYANSFQQAMKIKTSQLKCEVKIAERRHFTWQKQSR